MADETEPPFPVEEPVTTNPTTQTKTETKTETIETDSGIGKLRRQPGELLGMSGRFWVTMASILAGWHIVVLVLQSDMQNETKAIVAGTYLGLAAAAVNTYMGQNAGPSKFKPS